MSITTAVYSQGFFSTSGQENFIRGLKASGFNTVIGALIHPHQEGELYYGDSKIIENGKYIGLPEWPELIADLKCGDTSVTRLFFSVGGWGVGDFNNIKNLIARYGTGDANPLYVNFHALKTLFPAIDTIDLDNEEAAGYDPKVLAPFSQILGRIGFKVTFCPYTNPDVWIETLKTLQQSDPGLVTGFNLQCYDGGAGNSPVDWIQWIQNRVHGIPSDFVIPGFWKQSGLNGIEQSLHEWHDQNSALNGAFLWTYEDVKDNPAPWVEAIKTGLGAIVSAHV